MSWCVGVGVRVCVHEYLSARVCVCHDVCVGDSVCLCSFFWTNACVFMHVVVSFCVCVFVFLFVCLSACLCVNTLQHITSHYTTVCHSG